MSTMTVFQAHKMVQKSCGNCGFPFMVPDWFENDCLERGLDKDWYCPSCGCARVYSEGEIGRLKRELANEQARIRYWAQQYECERERHEHTENRRRAVAGHLTRMKKRVAGGVCPCCQRTFGNLARHMKTCHPDFSNVAD